jgi:hypothetical protein
LNPPRFQVWKQLIKPYCNPVASRSKRPSDLEFPFPGNFLAFALENCGQLELAQLPLEKQEDDWRRIGKPLNELKDEVRLEHPTPGFFGIELVKRSATGATTPHAPPNTRFLAQRASLTNQFASHPRYRMRQEIKLLTTEETIGVEAAYFEMPSEFLSPRVTISLGGIN